MANEVRQSIPLPHLNRLDDEGRPETADLNMSTYKSKDYGIVSSASVRFTGKGYITFAIGSDFSTRLMQDKVTRGTQNAIDRQHASVFTHVAVQDLLERVRLHYAAKYPKVPLATAA